MDSILNINPGLIFWTLLTFTIFLILLIKLGAKPIVNGLRNREKSIQDAIDNAEKANLEAKKVLDDGQAKLNNAHQEMAEIVSKGRQQAEEIIRKATDEAEAVKKTKVAEAEREIEISKNAAIKKLKAEVADLAIQAAEKILDENLDKDKHNKLVESYLEKLPKN